LVPSLYLDTARLGKMSPGAQDLHIDFSRFAGEVGASLLFSDFLWQGLESCPSELAARYPALQAWRGVSQLKKSLQRLTSLPVPSQVLLAGRSAQLMKLAATLLCRPCRNVLVTDLGWPTYHAILAGECRRTHRRMTCVSLGAELLSGNLTEREVTEKIRHAFVEHHCDGLFLTGVSHLGIRLPVQRIV
jgi:hypothetical protein